MAKPGTVRHQEEREALSKNQEVKLTGRWRRLEMFHPSINVK
jgi:hypothetical protein